MSRAVLEHCRKFFSFKEIYLKELRAHWGKYQNLYRDRSTITRLYTLTHHNTSGGKIDDATWNDLDMDILFDRLDNNITPIGAQYLYRQLRTLDKDEKILQLQHSVSRHVQVNKALREELQLNMWLLRSSNASSITDMLFGKMPTGDFPKKIAWLLASLSLTSIVMAMLVPMVFWLPILPVLANFVFAEAHAHKIGRHSVSYVFLRNLLTVAARLSANDECVEIDQLQNLRDNRQNIKRLQSCFSVVGLDSTSDNLLTAQMAFFLNLICLFDFLIFIRCSKQLHENKAALTDIYMQVASLDSAISVASYLQSNGKTCCPRFSIDHTMHFEAVTHPLLDDAVPNDYSSVSRSALITGSNMAGKSTFIKTIGVNLVLAQTLWLCHARAALVPRVSVMSSIKRSDSLENGKSYYFMEIEALLRLIKASEGKHHCIFLIDEILHGTNTVERIASAAAILERISRAHTVMVTTHDAELNQLLPDRYKSFHFQETSDLKNLFDYKLKEGHCTSRNAIALLEAIGFPADVVDQARRVASDLEH